MTFLSSIGIFDFLEYIYTIDFFHFVFSSPKNATIFLSWVFIIIPSIFYAAYLYKPKDTLGYISAALFWCLCAFLLILSPFSLLPYFFYLWLYRVVSTLWPKWKARMQSWFKNIRNVLPDILSFLLYPFLMFAMMIWVAIYAIFCVPFLSLINWLKKNIRGKTAKRSIKVETSIVPEPTPNIVDTHQLASNYINAKSAINPPRPKTQPPAQKVSRMLWSETDHFCKSIDNSSGSRQFMHIWAVYFYVVAKSTKSQAFINEVYSYFDDCAARYAGQFSSCLLSVSDMRSAYREIRPLLNASKIDPTNPAGTDLLWEFVVENVFGGTPLPSVARNQFDTSIRVLSRYSRYSCNNNSAQVKYSISEPSSDLLPDK